MEELFVRTLGEAITIEADLDDDLPPVRVDPGQLEQVLMNLAVNARDAMPEGGTLRLSTTVEDVESGADTSSLEPGTHVKLEVSDTGAGSTFTVWLPATEGEVAPRPVRPETGLSSRELSGSVLVVEDDANVQRVTRKILERAGLTVRTALDAESALHMLEEDADAFDLVITDLGLSGMGGRELLDRIRAIYPDLSVAAMSGHATGSPGKRGELPTDITFVQKLFTPDGLLEGVGRHLGQD